MAAEDRKISQLAPVSPQSGDLFVLARAADNAHADWSSMVAVLNTNFAPASHATDTNNPHSTTAAQVGAVPSVISAKGQLIGHSGVAEVAIGAPGADGQRLVSDAAETPGLKWEAIPNYADRDVAANVFAPTAGDAYVQVKSADGIGTLEVHSAIGSVNERLFGFSSDSGKLNVIAANDDRSVKHIMLAGQSSDGSVDIPTGLFTVAGQAINTYDVVAFCPGEAPPNGNLLYRAITPRQLRVPANGTGTSGTSVSGPAGGNYVVTIADDGNTRGILTWAAGQTEATLSSFSATEVLIAAGSVLTFTASGPATTLPQDLAVTLKLDI